MMILNMLLAYGSMFTDSFRLLSVSRPFVGLKNQAMYPCPRKSAAELGARTRRTTAGSQSIRRYRYKDAFSISCKEIVTNDLPESIMSFQTNIADEFDAMSFKPSQSLLQYETDILGFINFCLRTEDSALSGPSRSKVLNEITNDVFKAIMIGFEPLINETLSKFSSYREMVSRAPCMLIRPDDTESSPSSKKTAKNQDSISDSLSTGSPLKIKVIDNCDTDLDVAMEYVCRLEDILKSGVVCNDNNNMLGGAYNRGYKRLLTLLRDAGCKFSVGQICRPIPIDSNICLSLLDVTGYTLKPISIAPSRSKTQELNRIANIVSRAVLYGSKAEKFYIASHLDDCAVEFAQTYCSGDECSQEVLFIRALATLLRFGLTVAEESITFTGKSSGKGESSSSSSGSVDFEKELNKYIGKTDATTSGAPFGTSRVSGGIGSVTGLDQPPLRLFDTYQNAFYRVVEVCLTQMNAKALSTNLQEVPLQNEDMLLNFVAWEQGLRRNLTADLWKLNPSELAGSWELIDVGGVGSLNSIMTQATENYFDVSPVLKIDFTKDGNVEIKSSTSSGLRWYFRPGPAHLDTCEFYISSRTDADFLLKYVGFIDRGQRIESRFSKSPIRMTGRVVSIVKGEPRGSSRFVMTLKKK